ncbi:MAG: cupredoxin domain-containing protein [Candidatus Wildermuthbacteria bacterium]|nr:cupredoxin domain-containing protein [Candidatus Wildermuthbacteria bacterium]
MKYIIASLILAPFFVFAQNDAALPKAGLIPGSPFYFLDKLGETLQEFFTFNPQGKARLQITFAAERIAEIQVVFEKKGIEAKGIEKAQNRLLAHLASASAILATQTSKGKDVSQLAAELNTNLGVSKDSLKNTFKEQKQALKAQEADLKAQLRTAHKAGNTAEEEALAAQLGQVKAQLELIELKEDDIEDDIEDEEERIEEAMAEKAEAENKIRKAEREKEKVLREARKEGVELPANAFSEFDALLAQAKAAFDLENFADAKRLAKQAKDSLETIENTIDELEDVLEAKEEAEEEALERLEEEKEEKEEQIKEEMEQKKEKNESEEEKVEQPISQPKPEKKEFEVLGSEFAFSPASITVKSGQKVKIKFRNHGGAPHNLAIEGLGIGTKTIKSGDDASIEFTAPASGTYAFFCSVAGHREAGMKGQLIVE